MTDQPTTDHPDREIKFPPGTTLDARRIDKDTYEINYLMPNAIPAHTQRLEFQAGPIQAYGVNGLTSELVIEILIKRTRELNHISPCPENVNAIAALESALAWLNERTRLRVAAGVEGTNQAIPEPEPTIQRDESEPIV